MVWIWWRFTTSFYEIFCATLLFCLCMTCSIVQAIYFTWNLSFKRELKTPLIIFFNLDLCYLIWSCLIWSFIMTRWKLYLSSSYRNQLIQLHSRLIDLFLCDWKTGIEWENTCTSTIYLIVFIDDLEHC